MNAGHYRWVIATAVCAAGLLPAAAPAAPAMSGAQVLAQSRAIYAAMKSYADSGVVRTEFSLSRTIPLTVERHSFHTAYSAPRKFLLDFKKGEGGERLVIWGDGENFHTWWSETAVHEVYPRGQGATAFAVSALPTLGAALAVPPLLFSQAGLHGSLTDFELVRSEGVETIDGRTFYKLLGIVRLAYGNGAMNGGRSTTIWIDTKTLLVGQLLEDTPDGSAAGTVERVLTRFQPQSNPPVDSAVFQFVVPAG